MGRGKSKGGKEDKRERGEKERKETREEKEKKERREKRGKIKLQYLNSTHHAVAIGVEFRVYHYTLPECGFARSAKH